MHQFYLQPRFCLSGVGQFFKVNFERFFHLLQITVNVFELTHVVYSSFEMVSHLPKIFLNAFAARFHFIIHYLFGVVLHFLYLAMLILIFIDKCFHIFVLILRQNGNPERCFSCSIDFNYFLLSCHLYYTGKPRQLH